MTLILANQDFLFYILQGNCVEKYIPDDEFGVRCTNVITQLRLKLNGCNSLFYLQDLKRAHQCNNSGRAYPSKQGICQLFSLRFIYCLFIGNANPNATVSQN